MDNFDNWKEDPEVKAAFDWFIDLIGVKEWINRKLPIESYLRSLHKPKFKPTPLLSSSTKILFEDDFFGWYLFLAESYLFHMEDYEFSQGARVIPIFKTIGRNLEIFKKIRGVENRVRRISNSEKRSPDSGFFELLVALAYMKNNWEEVIFIPESPPSKTPDLHVKGENNEWFVECKRMAKSSDYSTKEREKWLKMWAPLSSYLWLKKRSLILDIVFHVELISLNDAFLERELIPKLNFVWSQGVVIDNEICSISVRPVDYKKIKSVMDKTDIKGSSSSLVELVAGKYDPARGFTSIMYGKPSSINDSYIDSIAFIAGALWHCDAEAAISKKARDIRRQLAASVSQLPEKKPGIIHVGLESHDGYLVEKERFYKIIKTVINFDALTKDLHWIYCHVFDPRVPPDDNWVFTETVIVLSRDNHNEEPLSHRSLVLPEDSEQFNGVFWD